MQLSFHENPISEYGFSDVYKDHLFYYMEIELEIIWLHHNPLRLNIFFQRSVFEVGSHATQASLQFIIYVMMTLI